MRGWRHKRFFPSSGRYRRCPEDYQGLDACRGWGVGGGGNKVFDLWSGTGRSSGSQFPPEGTSKKGEGAKADDFLFFLECHNPLLPTFFLEHTSPLFRPGVIEQKGEEKKMREMRRRLLSLRLIGLFFSFPPTWCQKMPLLTHFPFPLFPLLRRFSLSPFLCKCGESRVRGSALLFLCGYTLLLPPKLCAILYYYYYTGERRGFYNSLLVPRSTTQCRYNVIITLGPSLFCVLPPWSDMQPCQTSKGFAAF